jgi:hypothetical protein
MGILRIAPFGVYPAIIVWPKLSMGETQELLVCPHCHQNF